jgi:hypothetical protein
MRNNQPNLNPDIGANTRFQLETNVITSIVENNTFLLYSDFVNRNNFTNWKSGHNYQDIYDALATNAPNFTYDYTAVIAILKAKKKPYKCYLNLQYNLCRWVLYTDCICLIEVCVIQAAIDLIIDEMNRLMGDIISLSPEQHLLINCYKEVTTELNLFLFDNKGDDKQDFFSTIQELPLYLEKFSAPGQLIDKLNVLLRNLEMKISKIKTLRNFHSISQQLVALSNFSNDISLRHKAQTFANQMVREFKQLTVNV